MSSTAQDAREITGTDNHRLSRASRITLWALAAAFLVFACLELEIVPARLLDAADRAGFLLDAIFPPALEDPINVGRAAIESVQVAIAGTVFGIVLSLILAILAARNISPLRASGASHVQVFFQGVLPSVMGVFIAWSVFRFDINVRYSSVLGMVGAGGIGWELVRAAQVGEYDVAMGVTLVIFVMVLSTELLSDRLRQRAENEAHMARRKVMEEAE